MGGALVSLITTCKNPVDQCIRLVCNGAHCRSTCCEWCELEMENPQTELSRAEIELEGSDWAFRASK